MSDRVFPAGRIADNPGKMDDSFYALEGVAKNPDVSNVTIKDFDFFFYFLEWLSTPKKAVENSHFVAASEELLDYARADVARTPGHKHAHDIPSLAAASVTGPPALASTRSTHAHPAASMLLISADKDPAEIGIGHPAGNRARDVAGRHFWSLWARGGDSLPSWHATVTNA
jgi:hypothetical protein